MKRKLSFIIIFVFLLLPVTTLSQPTTPFVPVTVSDQGSFQLFFFWDLRKRESYIQIMNTDTSAVVVHGQIFNVADDCNESDFFDTYTPKDTHVYNLRDLAPINDGNPSGIVLPDDSYGFAVITVVNGIGGVSIDNPVLIGNFRIVDENGYEYRTNAAGYPGPNDEIATEFTFNFNNLSGTAFSEVVGITVDNAGVGFSEVLAPNILDTFLVMDIEHLYNDNEVPFSCRNLTFACVDEDNPLLNDLLQKGVGTFNVASFEYGINEQLSHSKGGELICPNNQLPRGFVRMETITLPGENQADMFVGFIGINDGGNRASMELISAIPF